jgi:hypothetical protein
MEMTPYLVEKVFDMFIKYSVNNNSERKFSENAKLLC